MLSILLGDGGGPLVCQRCRNCDWYLAGITSFGRGCGVAGFYSIYTRVDQFNLWINQITRRRVPRLHTTCNNSSQLNKLGTSVENKIHLKKEKILNKNNNLSLLKSMV